MVEQTRCHPLGLVPLILLLAGCTGGGTPAPDAASDSPPSSSTAPTSVTALPPPAGHYEAGCLQGQTNAAGFSPSGERLFNVDPLFIRDNFSQTSDGTPQLMNGVQWMKDPYWLRAGQTVTVTVALEQQKTVGLVAEYGATEGNTSVTFTACPAEKTPYTWWPGGFLVHGTETRCIRLSVEVAGAEGARRPVIPVGSAPCPTSW